MSSPQFNTSVPQRATPFKHQKSLSSTPKTPQFNTKNPSVQHQNLSVPHRKPLSSTSPSVLHKKPLGSTPSQFQTKNPSVQHLNPFGVKLRVVWNWEAFGVELRDFWDWKGVALFAELMCWTEKGVELRGASKTALSVNKISSPNSARLNFSRR